MKTNAALALALRLKPTVRCYECGAWMTLEWAVPTTYVNADGAKVTDYSHGALHALY